jgi:hypothetical protein
MAVRRYQFDNFSLDLIERRLLPEKCWLHEPRENGPNSWSSASAYRSQTFCR